jgi:hypothetical protein
VRSYWPVTGALALGSRRARRWLGVAALADAALAWWPQRGRGGLLRFAAGRRLDELGDGAGLWAGVIRARSARALRPARPPRV